MKYTKTIVTEQEITLSYNWKLDVQKVCSTAMHENNNNAEDAVHWIARLEAGNHYEMALKKEAISQIREKLGVTLHTNPNHMEDNEYNEIRTELEKIFHSIFGDVNLVNPVDKKNGGKKYE